MKEKKIQKHIYFTQTQIDILDDMIKNIPGINSYSEAARYAVLSMYDEVDSVKSIKHMEKKINMMAKTIDILAEMVAGGFDFQDVNAIRKKEDTYIYADAKKNVENEIQRSTTIKSNFKESNVERKESKTDFSRNFY